LGTVLNKHLTVPYQPVRAEEYVMEKKPIPIHAKYVWCEGGNPYNQMILKTE